MWAGLDHNVTSSGVWNNNVNCDEIFQALADLSNHKRASASLHLQRQMLLANEQLAQSTEDLSAGRALNALNWNRFTRSSDSLDQVSNFGFNFYR